MIPELDRLTGREAELLYKAPILVCILIAGADGRIDNKEIKGAISFAESKRQASLSSVSIIFREIAKDFEDKLKIVLQHYPYESTQRTPLVAEDLADLNTIWPKLEVDFAKEYYTSLLSIAEKIATASGGLLGYKTIGAEEAKLLHLPMIKNPAKHL
jgi:hypothetical protein